MWCVSFYFILFPLCAHLCIFNVMPLLFGFISNNSFHVISLFMFVLLYIHIPFWFSLCISSRISFINWCYSKAKWTFVDESVHQTKWTVYRSSWWILSTRLNCTRGFGILGELTSIFFHRGYVITVITNQWWWTPCTGEFFHQVVVVNHHSPVLTIKRKLWTINSTN